MVTLVIIDYFHIYPSVRFYFNKRGRVGYTGQSNLEHFGCDLDDAKRFFCQK